MQRDAPPVLLGVDRSQLWGQILAQVSEEHGLDFLHATDVVEGLGVVAKRRPAVVVLAHSQANLPVASFVAALKVDPGLRNIPIVVLSTAESRSRIAGYYQPDKMINRDEGAVDELHAYLGQFFTDAGPCVASRERILVVEDCVSVRRLTGQFLHLAGYDVTSAQDGWQALDLIVSQDFDLVLMDIEMPELDGRQTVRRLRRTGYSAPVLALTGHATPDFEAEALELGFNGVCAKPIVREDLLEACETHLVAHREA